MEEGNGNLMLSSKFISKLELLTWVREQVANFCDRNELPMLPVGYGPVPAPAKAIFMYLPLRIQVWDEYYRWLNAFPPQNRVWHVHHVLFHELWHYKQFLDVRKRGQEITPDIFNEDEAYIQGYIQADRVTGIMQPDEINPFLPNRKYGIGLGLGRR